MAPLWLQRDRILNSPIRNAIKTHTLILSYEPATEVIAGDLGGMYEMDYANTQPERGYESFIIEFERHLRAHI